MTFFKEPGDGKKVICVDFRPILTGYIITENGNLEVKLISADKMEAMKVVLENMDDRYAFDMHHKHPFTYEYNEERQTFTIIPGDVSIETILNSFQINNLIQPNTDETKSGFFPS